MLLELLALPLVAVSSSSLLPRQQLGQPVWGGVNITAEVLLVQASISTPICNATTSCVQFVAWIPQCLALHGDPGCWCANPDPLHYCAICMSSPMDNTTNPEQTQNAGAGHADYHKGCNAYEAFLNASVTSTSSIASATTSSINTATATAAGAHSGSSSIKSGALAGIIIGGIIGVTLIIVAALLTYRRMQNKHEEAVAAAAVAAAAQQQNPPRGPQPSWYTGGGMTDDMSKFIPPTPSAMSDGSNNIRGLPVPPLRHHTGSTSPPPPFNPYTEGGHAPVPSYSVEPSAPMTGGFTGDYDTRMLGNMDHRYSGAPEPTR